MFVLGNIVLGIAKVLDVALNIYMWVIIIRALVSWVNADPYNPIVRFSRLTEPVYPMKLAPPGSGSICRRSSRSWSSFFCTLINALSHRAFNGITEGGIRRQRRHRV
jgi:hypothetical protein